MANDKTNNESYLPIQGYEGLYEVSNLGNVRSLPGGRRLGIVLKQIIRITRYRFVFLCKNGMTKSFAVHRLVGKAFIPNPDNKPMINHIDNDPSNNKVSNLEWVTSKENMHHAMKQDRMNRSRGENHYLSRRTHCPRNHPYNEENTYIMPEGGRSCRECRRTIYDKRRVRKTL